MSDSTRSFSSNKKHARTGNHWALLPALILAIATLSACGPGRVTPAPESASSTPRRAAQLGPTSTASATQPSRPTSTATATLAPIPTPRSSEVLIGPTEAGVTLLLYSDFDCNLCTQVQQDLSAVIQNYPDQVRYVFRPFPLLAVNENSAQAAAAYYAASSFDLAKPMHDLLVEHRSEWAQLTPTEFRQWLILQATEIGLNAETFSQAMTDANNLERIETAYLQAQASGVPGVPFLIINDQPYLLDWTRSNLEAAVRLALLEDQQFASAPPALAPEQLPSSATFEFDIGHVSIQLFPESAPMAVSSFAFLIEQGWYQNTGLYLVQPNSLVMGGDPTNTGLGNAGYHFQVEIDPARRFDQAGMVALDNDGPASNSSRFLITLAPRPDLNGSYTIIGRVTEGLELLQSLPARDPLPDLLEPPEAILERIIFDQ